MGKDTNKVTPYTIRYALCAMRYTLYGAVVVLCAACAPKGEDCTISVSVVDKATGKPLPGVTVNVDGRELGATGEDGSCRGTLKLRYGKHNLSCCKQGYREAKWQMEFLPQGRDEAKDFEGEASLLEEIGELAAEFDYRIELERED